MQIHRQQKRVKTQKSWWREQLLILGIPISATCWLVAGVRLHSVEDGQLIRAYNRQNDFLKLGDIVV